MPAAATYTETPTTDAATVALRYGHVRGVNPAVVADIQQASRSANVDFSYLMAQAAQESSFQPTAKASTSSATGLFQFIDSTWLQAVKQFGGKYGLGTYADQISSAGSVADPAMRRQILNLRNDPKISSELAAEMAHQNKQTLETALGHPVSSTALYLAHFLGAGGATQLVKTIETASSTKAADLLPQAASANRSVFYDPATGQARTVAQIYSNFAQKLDAQMSDLGSSVGDDSELSMAAASMNESPADLVASGLSDVPDRLSQPMSNMMNVIALTALKLMGDHQPADNLSPDSQKKRQAPQTVAA